MKYILVIALLIVGKVTAGPIDDSESALGTGNPPKQEKQKPSDEAYSPEFFGSCSGSSATFTITPVVQNDPKTK